MADGGIDTYVTNASAMWRGLVPEARADGDYLRVDLPATTRLILFRPMAGRVVANLLKALPASKTVVVEDLFSESPAPCEESVLVERMPIMKRPSGDSCTATADGSRIVQVSDEHQLAAAERVIVDGFPLPQYRPWVPFQALPQRVLTLPGWRLLLAYLQGRPAAAGYTFDDGAAVGLYWLTTLPEYRSRGLARAILTTAISAHPERAFTLVATDAGLPLYRSLGFRPVVTATWYTRPPRG